MVETEDERERGGISFCSGLSE